MAMYDFKCDNPSCDFQEEYGISPSFSDPVPEKCPKCFTGNLVKQFPNCSKVGVDVVGGYEYLYGRKNWRKGKTDQDIAGYLVKGEDGKYKDPY
jgi:hypothetical protein